MELMARWSRRGDGLLRFIATVLAILMLLYGGYSLWDNYTINKNAFISDKLLKYKPINEHSKSLADLIKINPDVVAWLTIDKTNIDYPVVKCKDNLEYINKNVYGNFELSGSIFLDSGNSPDFSDQYNLVFGHHMESGAMFGDISKYMEKDYFQKHQTGTLVVAEKATYKIQIFACVRSDAANAIVYNTENQSKDTVGRLLNYIKTNNVQYQDIGVKEDDKIIALSTCLESTTNGRVILFGKMIR